MEILWDKEKNQRLILGRSVSFEEISGKILNGDYIAIMKNPTRKKQKYFIMQLRGYTWVVPFLIDEQERIVLKTAFPSRKYHKLFGGSA